MLRRSSATRGQSLGTAAVYANRTYSHVHRVSTSSCLVHSGGPSPFPRSSLATCTAKRGLVAVRAADQDPIEGLVNSKVFKSEMVMKEFNSIVSTMMDLAKMASSFPNFDMAGKRMYIDQMEANSERYEIFIKRLELSQDPGAREYLRATNSQMLEAGFTLPTMFAGLKQSLVQYRTMVEAEERASVDPITYSHFLKDFKSAWSQSSLGRIDMDYLSRVTDPEILMRAQRDPQFWKAIKEISENPDPSAMSKWLDHPNIGPLVSEMWKSTQGRGGTGG